MDVPQPAERLTLPLEQAALGWLDGYLLLQKVAAQDE
jgi:hypothetical protein